MDKERTNRSSPVWIVLIVLLLASGPLYVLSTGPAVWLMARGAVHREQLATVYAPLDWLERRVPSFGKALEAYLGLWVPTGSVDEQR